MAAGPRVDLSHVYWLGGGSGAGKTTIARRLAERHGWAVYDTDAAMTEHAARLGPEEAPALAAFAGMDMDERWVRRSPEVMLETFHWFRGEGFALMVEDLLALAGRPVVAEGFRLLPRLVAPLATPGQAVWLVPTRRFRQQSFTRRGSLGDIPGRTSDPVTALANLLERDRLFTERLRTEAQAHSLPVLTVDVGDTEEQTLSRVEATWGR